MTDLAVFSATGLSAQTMTNATAGTGDTAAQFVQGGVTIDTSGTRSPQIKFTQAAAASCYARWAFATQSAVFAFRFYWTTGTTWPSATAPIALITDDAGVGVRIAMSGTSDPGRLRIYVNGGATVLDQTASALLSNSHKYRVEGVYNPATKAIEVKIFDGESDIALDTLNATDATFGSTVTRFVCGNTGTTPTTPAFYIDDLKVATGSAYLSSPYVVPTSGPTYDVAWAGAGLAPSAMTAGSAGTGDVAPSFVSGVGVDIVTATTRSPRIRITQPADNNAYVRWQVASRTQSRFRFYFKTPTAWPASTTAIALVTDDAGVGARISLAGTAAPGVIRLYANPTAAVLAQTTNNALELNTLYRFEGQIDQGATTFKVQISKNEAVETVAELVATSSTIGTAHTRFILGNTNVSPVLPAVEYDDVVFDAGTAAIGSPYLDPPVPPRTIDVQWDGTGATTGAFTVGSVGTGDIAADLVVGGVTVDSSGPRPTQIKMTQTSGTQCYVRWSFPSRSQSAVRFYVTTPAAWPSSSTPLAIIGNDSDVGCRITLAGTGSPGSLRLYENPTGAILDQTANGQLVVSTRYRIEAIFDQVNGTLDCTIYKGDSDQPVDILRGTSAAFGTTHTRLRLGNVNTTPLVSAYYFDEVLLDEGTQYLSTPYLVVTPPAVADAWLKVGSSKIPIKYVALKSGSSLIPIKYVGNKGGTVGPVDASIAANAVAGDGQATLTWTVTPAQQTPVEGVYVGRNGTGTGGAGPWESALLTSLSGSQVFSNLVNNTTYQIYIELQVGGVRTQRQNFTVTPTGVVAPPSDYGGTDGWILKTNVNLAVEPAGTQYTGTDPNGSQRTTDLSYNRPSNATYQAGGTNGLFTITAERATPTSKIFSADVMWKGSATTCPAIFAVEVDYDFIAVGPGMGHAIWFRPNGGGNGQGEIDLLEYCGAQYNKSTTQAPYEYKCTVIHTTSAKYQAGQKAFGIFRSQAGGTFEGRHKIRFEHQGTQMQWWFDGVLAGTVTKTAFESTNGAGTWDDFGGTNTWYPRFTLQTGNGSTSSNWGNVPADWVGPAKVIIREYKIYRK